MRGFQFKQFFIQHDRCAMKVGTDSIMLGSWAQVEHAKYMLDIGTGSGLLAIMLAQRAQNCEQIVGLDIDPDAIEQAKLNAQSCPWKDCLTFTKCALQEYNESIKFDVIVSNPPYFPVNRTANQSHKDSNRINARQTNSLSHTDLLTQVSRLLAPNGTFYCVLPEESTEAFIKNAEYVEMHCTQQLKVSSMPSSKVIRRFLAFTKVKLPPQQSKLNIYQQAGIYSADYRRLCQEYYLKF